MVIAVAQGTLIGLISNKADLEYGLLIKQNRKMVLTSKASRVALDQRGNQNAQGRLEAELLAWRNDTRYKSGEQGAIDIVNSFQNQLNNVNDRLAIFDGTMNDIQNEEKTIDMDLETDQTKLKMITTEYESVKKMVDEGIKTTMSFSINV